MVKRQDPFLTSVSVISFSVSPTAMTLITHASRNYLVVKNPSIIVNANPAQSRRCSGNVQPSTNVQSNVEVDNARCHVPIIPASYASDPFFPEWIFRTRLVHYSSNFTEFCAVTTE